MADRTSLGIGGHHPQWLGVVVAMASAFGYAVYQAQREPAPLRVLQRGDLAPRGPGGKRGEGRPDNGAGSGSGESAAVPVRPNRLQRFFLKLAGDDPDEPERRAAAAVETIAAYGDPASVTFLDRDFFPERRKPGSRMR